MPTEGAWVSDLFWRLRAHVHHIKPCFLLSLSVAGIDERREISGIIFAIPNGLYMFAVPEIPHVWPEIPTSCTDTLHGTHATLFVTAS